MCSLYPSPLTFFFFLKNTAPPETSPLPLPAALPTSGCCEGGLRPSRTTLPSRGKNGSGPVDPAGSPPSPGANEAAKAAKCGGTAGAPPARTSQRSEEHTSELQSQSNLVCRLLLEKKK